MSAGSLLDLPLPLGRDLRRNFLAWLSGLADFVFPPYCGYCQKRLPDGWREPICPACWQQAVLWSANSCQRCGAALGADVRPRLCGRCRIPDWPCADLRTPGPFRGVVAQAVHLLKYSEKKAIARRLASLMAGCLEPGAPHLGADLLVAVPLHPAKKRERGYNQAQLLADELSAWIGRPTDPRAVCRRRHTSSQTKLGRRERQENVRGIFGVKDRGRVEGRTIVLIDDVLTTGATMGSCAQALLEAGATSVLALTAAAAPLDGD